jgi:hypothetical protein
MAEADDGESGRRPVEQWRVEFEHVLHRALIPGITKPLREYVAAGKPIPNDIVHVKQWKMPGPMSKLVDELLGQPVEERRGRGRPRRVSSDAPPAEQAERNVAWALAYQMASWRKQTGKRRVPRAEMDEWVSLLVEEAAKAFKVRVTAISTRNILAYLKKCRFKEL